MEAHNALWLEVGETLFEQTAGYALALVLGRHGEVIDLESAAIVEQNGSAQNEASHFSVYNAFQTVMLLTFKQFADMDGGIFHRPVVVPRLARKRRRINGAILFQMLNSDWTDDEVLHKGYFWQRYWFIVNNCTILFTAVSAETPSWLKEAAFLFLKRNLKKASSNLKKLLTPEQRAYWLESIERDMRNMDQPKKYVFLEQFGQELMATVKSKICLWLLTRFCCHRWLHIEKRFIKAASQFRRRLGVADFFSFPKNNNFAVWHTQDFPWQHCTSERAEFQQGNQTSR